MCAYIYCIYIHTQTFVFCLLLYLCVLNHLFKPVSPVIIQQQRIYSGLLPLYVLNSLICLLENWFPLSSAVDSFAQDPTPQPVYEQSPGPLCPLSLPWAFWPKFSPVKGEEAVTSSEFRKILVTVVDFWEGIG